MSVTVARTLDLKQYACPLPVVKTAQAMRELVTGDLVEVLATDPGSVADFTAWCKATGNHLVAWSREEGIYRFLIRKR